MLTAPSAYRSANASATTFPISPLAEIVCRDLSLQAMRHTVRTLLDNTSAKTAFVDELLGHESEERRSEGRRYRKEIFLLT